MNFVLERINEKIIGEIRSDVEKNEELSRWIGKLVTLDMLPPGRAIDGESNSYLMHLPEYRLGGCYGDMTMTYLAKVFNSIILVTFEDRYSVDGQVRSINSDEIENLEKVQYILTEAFAYHKSYITDEDGSLVAKLVGSTPRNNFQEQQ